MTRLAADTALVVIDVQNDFCPGGALAVPEGDAVVPVINGLMERFETIVLTQDWHPAHHGSFAANHANATPFSVVELDYGPQVLWPSHCVQGTRGAEFYPALRTEPAQLVIRKGFRAAIDSYSAFFENDHRTVTGLAGYLRERGIARLVLAGLATDFCVRFSAVDAARLGFQVAVVDDACRGIDLQGSLDAAMSEMAENGVAILRSEAV